MELTKTQSSTPSTRRYFIAGKVLLSRAALVVGALAFVPVLLALMGEEVDGLMIGLFAGMIVLCLVVFFGVARLTWLEMDEAGIRYRGLGMTIATRWDNIDAIGTQFVTGEGSVEGLILRESGLDVNGAVRAGSWLSWRAQMSLRDYEYFLPISNLQTKEWRNAAFGQELRRRAPRLFE